MEDRFKFRVFSKEFDKMFYFGFTEKGSGFSGLPSFYYIEKPDIMQSTGLKDKNGKLICEYDLIKNIITGKTYKIYEVMPLEWKLWNVKTRKWNDLSQIYNSNNIEIIGNIYENKELLKENKNGKF